MGVVMHTEDKGWPNQYNFNYIFLYTTVVIPKQNSRISVKINKSCDLLLIILIIGHQVKITIVFNEFQITAVIIINKILLV